MAPSPSTRASVSTVSSRLLAAQLVRHDALTSVGAACRGALLGEGRCRGVERAEDPPHVPLGHAELAQPPASETVLVVSAGPKQP